MNSWVTMSLGTLADIMVGQVPSADTLNKSGNGLPYYTGSGDINAGKARQHCTKARRVVPKGSIVLSVRAPFGVAELAVEDCCIGRGVAAITPKGGTVDPEYLMYYLQASKNRLEALAQGTAVMTISQRSLAGLEVRFPESLEEQRRIAETVRRANNLLKRHDQARGTIEQLVEAVKDRAFSNKLKLGV